MFRSPLSSTNFYSSSDRSLLSVNSVPSALKSNFYPSSALLARAKQPNPFRIRTSAKCARKSFRIRTSKTRHLKSFRIRTYKKNGGGGCLFSACANPAIAGTIRVLNPISKEGTRCDD
jgi:hypothetical protein